MKKIFCLTLVLFWIGVISSLAEESRGIEVIDESFEPGPPLEEGKLDRYLSEEATSPLEEETPENKFLAPVAKPIVSVIQGLESVLEPFLEEREIKNEKGEVKAKIKPKEGKLLEVPF